MTKFSFHHEVFFPFHCCFHITNSTFSKFNSPNPLSASSTTNKIDKNKFHVSLSNVPIFRKGIKSAISMELLTLIYWVICLMLSNTNSISISSGNQGISRNLRYILKELFRFFNNIRLLYTLIISVDDEMKKSIHRRRAQIDVVICWIRNLINRFR